MGLRYVALSLFTVATLFYILYLYSQLTRQRHTRVQCHRTLAHTSFYLTTQTWLLPQLSFPEGKDSQSRKLMGLTIYQPYFMNAFGSSYELVSTWASSSFGAVDRLSGTHSSCQGVGWMSSLSEACGVSCGFWAVTKWYVPRPSRWGRVSTIHNLRFDFHEPPVVLGILTHTELPGVSSIQTLKLCFWL